MNRKILIVAITAYFSFWFLSQAYYNLILPTSINFHKDYAPEIALPNSILIYSGFLVIGIAIWMRKIKRYIIVAGMILILIHAIAIADNSFTGTNSSGYSIDLSYLIEMLFYISVLGLLYTEAKQ